MVERRRPQEKREGPIGRGMRSEQERPEWQKRVHRDKDVEKSPLIPSEITPEDLDMGVRVQLKTLTAENAEMVARHLAMVSLLIDDDPKLAHKHALAASRRASRLAVVHETLGLTAYAVEDFALALRELLTHRRLSGSNDQLPIIVDAERGMGRPERALEAVVGVDRSKLPVGVRINLAIALSGARLDLGQAKLAKQELEIAELGPQKVFEQSPLLFRSYAEVLRELGSSGDEWDELASRAEAAFESEGEEVFSLIEEISIPTSEDFERKPKREYTPRDGDRPSRPARQGSDRPYHKRDDTDRSARKPRSEGERSYSRPESERSFPRRDSSDRPARTPRPEGERSYPRRDSSYRPARATRFNTEDSAADSSAKPNSKDRYYGKGDGTNRSSADKRPSRSSDSGRSGSSSERKFVKKDGQRPSSSRRPGSAPRGGRGKTS